MKKDNSEIKEENKSPKISVNPYILDLDKIEFKKFPGGELHVNLTKEQILTPIMVSAKIRNSEDVMKLVLVTDVINQHRNKGTIALYLPYVPYARQDRVANFGEALSIKAFASIINLLGYENVHICDPHSDVAPALIDRSINCLNIETLLSKVVPNYTDCVVIAPDAGAYKKLSKIITKTPLVQCTKHRDTNTGFLSNLQIHTDEDLTGKDLIVVDDICDGGKTFELLADAIKAKCQPKSLSLYVTHGIFSKGLDILKEHYDKVYTTDSFCQLEGDDYLVVEKLMENV